MDTYTPRGCGFIWGWGVVGGWGSTLVWGGWRGTGVGRVSLKPECSQTDFLLKRPHPSFLYISIGRVLREPSERPWKHKRCICSNTEVCAGHVSKVCASSDVSPMLLDLCPLLGYHQGGCATKRWCVQGVCPRYVPRPWGMCHGQCHWSTSECLGPPPADTYPAHTRHIPRKYPCPPNFCSRP